MCSRRGWGGRRRSGPLPPELGYIRHQERRKVLAPEPAEPERGNARCRITPFLLYALVTRKRAFYALKGEKEALRSSAKTPSGKHASPGAALPALPYSGRPRPPQRQGSFLPRGAALPAGAGARTATAPPEAERGQRGAPAAPARRCGGTRLTMPWWAGGGGGVSPGAAQAGAREGGKASAPSRRSDAANPPHAQSRRDHDAVNTPADGPGWRGQGAITPPPLSRPGPPPPPLPGPSPAQPSAPVPRRLPPAAGPHGRTAPPPASRAVLAARSAAAGAHRPPPPARRSRGAPRGAGTYRPRGGGTGGGGAGAGLAAAARPVAMATGGVSALSAAAALSPPTAGGACACPARCRAGGACAHLAARACTGLARAQVRAGTRARVRVGSAAGARWCRE